MDYGQAFSYVWKDPDWIKKILIASVVALVGTFTGIVMIPLAGWSVAIARHVIRGEEPVLAEWADLGTLIVDGLKVVVVALVWFIPYFLVFGCFFTIAAIAGNQDQSGTVQTVTQILNACIGLPYLIVWGLLLPASIGEIADHGQLGRALNPLNAFKVLRANLGGYVVCLVIVAAVMIIIYPLSFVVCLLGEFVVLAYMYALSGHLYGQAYKVAQSRGAAV